jgi:hypothetical protein
VYIDSEIKKSNQEIKALLAWMKRRGGWKSGDGCKKTQQKQDGLLATPDKMVSQSIDALALNTKKEQRKENNNIKTEEEKEEEKSKEPVCWQTPTRRPRAAHLLPTCGVTPPWHCVRSLCCRRYAPRRWNRPQR